VRGVSGYIILGRKEYEGRGRDPLLDVYFYVVVREKRSIVLAEAYNRDLSGVKSASKR